MKRLLISFLGLPLVACYGGERRNSGECPAGETCSDLTPGGLDFIGNRLAGELLLSGPRATAIGGTQAIALEYDRGDGVDVALDLPFSADDDGGNGVRVDAISGSQVVVRGAGSRSNYLRILDSDGLLMDRKELTGAALSTIELVPNDFESIPADLQIAFAPGAQEFGVALYGDVQTSSGPKSERLIDTSMSVSLAGAERKTWDTFAIEATVGTHLLSVEAGDKPAANLDFVVVAQADALASIQPTPTTIAPSGSASVCFKATAASRYIAGLTWTYVIDGTDTQIRGNGTLTRNCITVTTTKTSGTVTLQASAGGQSTSLALTVGAARESLEIEPLRATSHAIATAGDRATM
jgi:hypothetical protein